MWVTEGYLDLLFFRIMQAELSSTAAVDETQTYFDSYDDINVHKIMLKDTSRLLAYKCFMEENCEQFAKKIVVDVGSGTGILSLLAARCGAKHVYYRIYF